jgi:hypothetical protein
MHPWPFGGYWPTLTIVPFFFFNFTFTSSTSNPPIPKESVCPEIINSPLPKRKEGKETRGQSPNAHFSFLSMSFIFFVLHFGNFHTKNSKSVIAMAAKAYKIIV